MPDNQPTDAAVSKVGYVEWIKLMLGGGFAIVVGWACLKFVLGESGTNSAFTRNELLQQSKESAAALTTVARAIDGLATEIEENTDESAELRIDVTALLHQLRNTASAVRAHTAVATKAVEAITEDAAQP